MTSTATILSAVLGARVRRLLSISTPKWQSSLRQSDGTKWAEAGLHALPSTIRWLLPEQWLISASARRFLPIHTKTILCWLRKKPMLWAMRPSWVRTTTGIPQATLSRLRPRPMSLLKTVCFHGIIAITCLVGQCARTARLSPLQSSLSLR